MKPSQLINIASLGIGTIGVLALYLIDTKEIALAAIVMLALFSLLQSDVTNVVTQGAAIITSKLLSQAVELRDQLDDLEEIVQEAAKELQDKNETAALNTLTAGLYMLQRRQNG